MNRLRRVVKKNTLQEVATYQYDSLNRRVRKETTAHATTGASFTRFLYDGWHAIEERDVSNLVTKQFVYGEQIDEIRKMDRYISGVISATYYYHDDILGSVCALSDTNGHVVERVKYSPYGQPYFLDSNQQPIRDLQGNFETQSSIRNPLLFTAARYDSELSQRTSSQTTDKVGNYYLRNRYLNSNQGRFLTRDPIGIWTDDANLGGGYSYAGNDPVNRRDSLGLRCFKGDDDEKEKLRGLIRKLLKKVKIRVTHLAGDSREDADYFEGLVELALRALLESSKTFREVLQEILKNGDLTITIDNRSGVSSYDHKKREITLGIPRADQQQLIETMFTLSHEIGHAYHHTQGYKGETLELWEDPIGNRRRIAPLAEEFALKIENQIRGELNQSGFFPQGVPYETSYGPYRVRVNGTLYQTTESTHGWDFLGRIPR